MSHQSGEYSWSSVLWAFTSLLGFFFPLFGNDMPFVIALFVFFRGDSCWFFVWQHRFAAHEILEAGRRKYEHEAEGLGSHGFYTYPGIRRNECDSSRVQIAFLVSHMNMSGSFFDQQNFILPQVFVQWYFVFGNHVFGAENQVLRAVVLRAHLHFSPAEGVWEQPGNWLRNWIVRVEFERRKPQRESHPLSQTLSELNLSSWHLTS